MVPPERAGGYAAVVVVIGWLVGLVAMILGGIFLASAGTNAMLGSASAGSSSTVTVDAK